MHELNLMETATATRDSTWSKPTKNQKYILALFLMLVCAFVTMKKRIEAWFSQAN
jgi:hypothetical protein